MRFLEQVVMTARQTPAGGAAAAAAAAVEQYTVKGSSFGPDSKQN